MVSTLVQFLPLLALLAGSTTALPSAEIATVSKWPARIASKAYGPSSSLFVQKTTRWSTFEAPTFNEVFLPANEQELSMGLKYLSSINRPWLTKSGGHGYSPTLGAIQNATMINMENFNYVRMNLDLSVTMGSGTNFSDLTTTVGNAGREITVGACPCVGAMGAMLGGGLGRLEGLHGLTSDALRSATVVLWNGDIIQVSNRVNSDLLWGLKGAGQNFGIVTQAVFETYPATNGGLQYSTDLYFTQDKLEVVFGITNDLMNPHLDPALSIVIALASNPVTLEPVIIVNIVYPGAKAKGQAYAHLYSNHSISFEEHMVPWVNLADVALPSVVLGGCAKGFEHNEYSVQTEYLQPAIFRKAFNDYTTFVQANPAANNSVFFIETFGQKKLTDYPADISAFAHRKFFRNAVAISTAYVDPSVAAASDAFAKKWRDILAQKQYSGYDSLHVYQNYAHGDEKMSAVYGTEKWRQVRLTTLKNKFDPRGYFNGYHAIPSKMSAWT